MQKNVLNLSIKFIDYIWNYLLAYLHMDGERELALSFSTRYIR